LYLLDFLRSDGREHWSANRHAAADAASQIIVLLSYLVTSGPMTMAQLAKLMSMDRATTGHNLRPLVRDGLGCMTACVSRI
jgi:DNA-binding MarR family transcriptional regulator